MTKLVFSYSHADEAMRNELEKHLSPLKRQGLIESWHDRRIVAGQEFIGAIDQHFEEAEIVLLLVSPDFINSDYCFDVEMKRAVERHDLGEAVVIPVILRLCHWHELPFGKLLAATPDGKPVTQYASLDEGFYLVVDAIKKVLRTRQQPGKAAATTAAVAKSADLAATASPSQGLQARSSNLRIKKTFTDLDRDQVRRECTTFVAKYFANSLEELKRRNPELSVDFNQRDAGSFEATIYANGKRQCFCGIWQNSQHFGGEILFNHNGITPGSFNEAMNVADDGYVLGFKPLGMAHFGREQKGLLSNEGVAEYFWELFIRSLQQ